MNNQAKVDANLLSLYRQLWRLSQEDIALFCARYGVSDAERQLLVAPSAPKIKTLLPVIAVESRKNESIISKNVVDRQKRIHVGLFELRSKKSLGDL